MIARDGISMEILNLWMVIWTIRVGDERDEEEEEEEGGPQWREEEEGTEEVRNGSFC